MPSLVNRAAIRAVAAGVLFGSIAVSGGATAQTLKAVKERGAVVCGVSQGIVGFSDKSDKGGWTGFDADFCRALAAAIFNDPAKVTFVPLSASDRFGALRSKQIDVLSRNSTWTMGRETELGLAFAGVTFYDGQGLMVRHARKVSSGLELNGSKVCVQSGTTTELNLTAGDRPTLLLRAICKSGGLDAQGEPMRFKARPAAPYGSVGRVRVPPMFVPQQDIA